MYMWRIMRTRNPKAFSPQQISKVGMWECGNMNYIPMLKYFLKRVSYEDHSISLGLGEALSCANRFWVPDDSTTPGADPPGEYPPVPGDPSDWTSGLGSLLGFLHVKWISANILCHYFYLYVLDTFMDTFKTWNACVCVCVCVHVWECLHVKHVMVKYSSTS